MHTLWAVKYDEGGTEMYGDDYTDIWVMNRVHHLAASGGSCDHVRFPSYFMAAIHSTAGLGRLTLVSMANMSSAIPGWLLELLASAILRSIQTIIVMAHHSGKSPDS